MPVLTDQVQMEAYVKSDMREMVTNMADAIYGMMHPRLVACDFEARSVEAVFATQPWMRNGMGVVHGGMIATMLDSIGGIAARCFVPYGVVAPTVTLQTSYLRTVPIGTQVHVRANVIFPGKHILQLQTVAFDGEDSTRIFATGSAVHYVKI